MTSFLNQLSEDFTNLEKCGDVVVSPKDNTVGLYCNFCSDIYTNLLEFLHHLHWMHSDVLAFTREHNVYSVEELLSLPSPPQVDVQSQIGSSDSLLSDTADTLKRNNSDGNSCFLTERKTKLDPTINRNVLHWQAEVAKCYPNLAEAEPQESDVLVDVQARLFLEENTINMDKSVKQEEYHDLELQQMLQAAGLQNIEFQLEQPIPDNLNEENVAVNIIHVSPHKSVYSKVNYIEKESKMVSSKPQRRETVKRNSEKLQTNLDLKSYAIARSVRKREQQQRFSNIKKRIFRSFENEPPETIHNHIRKSHASKLTQIKSRNVQLQSFQANLPVELSDKTKKDIEIKAEKAIKTSPSQNENIHTKMKTKSNTKESKFTPKVTYTAKEESKINKNSEIVQLLQNNRSINVKSKLEKNMVKEKPTSLKLTDNAKKENQIKELEKYKEYNSKPAYVDPVNFTDTCKTSNLNKTISNTRNVKDQTKHNELTQQSAILINKVEVLPNLFTPVGSQQTLIQKPVDETPFEDSILLNQKPIQNLQCTTKRKQIELDNSVQMKKTKTETKTNNEPLAINITNNSTVEYLQNDIRANSKAGNLTNVATNTVNQGLAENEIKEEKAQATTDTSTGTTAEASEIKINTAPKDNLREDMTLLQIVGLQVVKNSNYEDSETVEYCDALRVKAAKFSKLLRLYDTVWNPKRFQALYIQETSKQLAMLTYVINSEFKANLNVNELKRILNLVNSWYAQQIDLKFFKKVTLSSTVDHYLLLFAFLPKINRCLYYCEWCDESYSNKSRYEMHRVVHMCGYTCSHCKRGFKKRGFLINHVKTQHGKDT